MLSTFFALTSTVPGLAEKRALPAAPPVHATVAAKPGDHPPPTDDKIAKFTALLKSQRGHENFSYEEFEKEINLRLVDRKRSPDSDVEMSIRLLIEGTLRPFPGEKIGFLPLETRKELVELLAQGWKGFAAEAAAKELKLLKTEPDWEKSLIPHSPEDDLSDEAKKEIAKLSKEYGEQRARAGSIYSRLLEVEHEMEALQRHEQRRFFRAHDSLKVQELKKKVAALEAENRAAELMAQATEAKLKEVSNGLYPKKPD